MSTQQRSCMQQTKGSSNIYATYLNEATRYDKAMLSQWNDNLDNLLIVAGLFSAVITAFLVESYKLLQPDPQIQIVSLLVSVTAQLAITNNILANGTVPSNIPDALQTFQQAIIVSNPQVSAFIMNLFWFISLACSISSAFIAMFVKQWLQAYLLEVPATVEDKALQRHFRYSALSTWKIPEIITILPVLLQSGLSFFFIGLIVLLWTTSPVLAYIMAVIVSFLLLFHTFTLVMPQLYRSCPYKSPFTVQLSIYLQGIRGCFAIQNRKLRSILSSRKNLKTVFPSKPFMSLAQLEKIEIDRRRDSLEIGIIEWLVKTSLNDDVIDTALKTISSFKPNFLARPQLEDSAVIEYLAERLNSVSKLSQDTSALFTTYAEASLPFLCSIFRFLRLCHPNEIDSIRHSFRWRTWIVLWREFDLQRAIYRGWNPDALAMYICATSLCEKNGNYRREFGIMVEMLNQHSKGNISLQDYSLWALLDSITLWGVSSQENTRQVRRLDVIPCIVNLLYVRMEHLRTSDPVIEACAFSLQVFVLEPRRGEPSQDELTRSKSAHAILIRALINIVNSRCYENKAVYPDEIYDVTGELICKLLQDTKPAALWPTDALDTLWNILQGAISSHLKVRVLVILRQILSRGVQFDIEHAWPVILRCLEKTAVDVSVATTELLGQVMYWPRHRRDILETKIVSVLIDNLKSSNREIANVSSIVLMNLSREFEAQKVMIDNHLITSLTAYFLSNLTDELSAVYWAWFFIGSPWRLRPIWESHSEDLTRLFRPLAQLLDNILEHNMEHDDDQLEAPFSIDIRRRQIKDFTAHMKQLMGGHDMRSAVE